MTEMLERVARAIADEDGSSLQPEDWYFRGLARAAVDAMRETSEDFVWDAAYSIEPKLDCIRGHDLGGDEALKIFNAVIDAALEGKLK